MNQLRIQLVQIVRHFSFLFEHLKHPINAFVLVIDNISDHLNLLDSINEDNIDDMLSMSNN